MTLIEEPIEVRLARRFHEEYERAAPSFGWKTQTPVSFQELPPENRDLMIYVCGLLVADITDAVSRNLEQMIEAARKARESSK